MRLDERVSGTTGPSFESRSVYLCGLSCDVQEFPDITFPDSIRRTPRQRRRIEAPSEFTAIRCEIVRLVCSPKFRGRPKARILRRFDQVFSRKRRVTRND